jgi:hypothetical protein
MSELAKRVFWKCELRLIEYSRLKTFEYMYKRQLHGVLVLQIFQSRVEAFAFPPSSSAEHMLNSTLVPLSYPVRPELLHGLVDRSYTLWR